MISMGLSPISIGQSSLNPGFAASYYNRGLILRQRGEFDQAAADFREALRLNPNFTNAKLMLDHIR